MLRVCNFFNSLSSLVLHYWLTSSIRAGIVGTCWHSVSSRFPYNARSVHH